MLLAKAQKNQSYFTLRLSVFYAVLFIIVGVYVPFFPVWLKFYELEPSEISIILAVPLFIRLIFTPVISFYADQTSDYRNVILLLAVGVVITTLSLFYSFGFWQLLFIVSIFSICWTTIMPLTETLAMVGVREKNLDYGRMRLWGSLMFIFVSFSLGYIIDQYGATSVLWSLVLAGFLTLIAAFFLPTASVSKNEPDAKITYQANIQDILLLLKLPVFWVFIFGASLVQASHAVFYGFGVIHWQSLGISTTQTGILWSIGVISEVILFAYSRVVISYLGSVNLLLFAGGAAIIRWFIMAFDPSLFALYPLQVLHAFTFGAGHIGAMHFIALAIPARLAATGQGIYAAASMGFIMAIATLSAGPLYKVWAGEAYLVMALVGILSMFFVYYLKITWDQKTII